MDDEERLSKALKTLFSNRFAKFWYAIIIFNIVLIITIKTLDTVYPSSVCCCSCNNQTCFNNINSITSSRDVHVFKRWGGLEDCSRICESYGLTNTSEVSLKDYNSAVIKQQAFINNFTKGGFI